ncbi:hypothetical protein GC167_05950 [bacterium]|nr:hypothetical protein [bacterium]
MNRSLRDRQERKEPRVELVNKLTNNMGQMLLTLADGDWDLALSVSLSLFASTVAQSAVAHEESAEELFDEMGPPARNAVLTFEKAFIAAELAERMAADKEDGDDDETDD